MGKQKKMARRPSKKSLEIYDDNASIDPTSRGFVYDDADDFNDDREDAILKAVTFKQPKQIDREQVLGVGGSSDSEIEDSEEDDDAMYMEDDIFEKREQKMPDDRAWGKKKYLYYHTDTMDERLKKITRTGKTDHFTETEGAAARRFQERLDAQVLDLPDDDLMVEAPKEKKDEEDGMKLSFDGDISTLTDKQKRKLLKQQSPEFFLISKDFEEKSTELNAILKPLMEARKAGKLQHTKLDHYITTKYELVTRYMMNACAYFMLREESPNISSHPVITRLTQYRFLLQQLDDINLHLKSKLEELAQSWNSSKFLDLPHDPSYTIPKKKSKMLGILGKKSHSQKRLRNISNYLDSASEGDEEEEEEEDLEECPEMGIEIENESVDGDQEPVDDEENSDIEKSEQKDDDERRGITYKMQKNKGLMPSRRRDQQNPRVKYKMKYNKKLKLRKGQFREVRKEDSRYTGERSGINVRAVKSVKLK